MLRVVTSILVGAAQPSAHEAGSVESGPACESLGADGIAVTADGTHIGAFVDELELRVRCPVAAGRGASNRAWLDARFEGTRYHVELTLPDGRVFRESGESPQPLSPTRVAASDAAALIEAIGRGERSEDAVVAPVESLESVDEADLGAANTGEEAAAAATEASEPAAVERGFAPPSAEPGWELGGALTMAPVLAAGSPGFGDAYLGAGVELALDARAPNALRVWLGLRPWGRSSAGHSILRTRVATAVGAGHTWRHFNVSGVAGPLVSIVSARTPDGARGLFVEGRRVPPLAVGGLVRVQGSGRWDLGGLHLEFGPVIDLQATTVPYEGGTVAALRSAEGRALTRVGGLEIALGLQVGGYWALPQR